VAALAAWPLLDEPLGLAGLFGVAIVSAGLLLAVRGPAR
jgi:drug/metabolite transporter (DMT)-like permease